MAKQLLSVIPKCPDGGNLFVKNRLLFCLLTVILVSPLALAQKPDRAIGPPERQPTATPTPTPRPTPTPGPSAEELRRAADAGRSAGAADGTREGADDGAEDGRRRGQREGRERGYTRCETDERNNNFNRGYQIGLTDGARAGADEGSRAGESDGERKGRDEGERDGLDAARAAAQKTEIERGRTRGFQQADAQTSAIVARAQTEGAAAGDQDALTRARSEDYQKGRDDYRKTQFQLRPRLNETFSLSDGQQRLSRLPFTDNDNMLWSYLLPTTTDIWSNHAPSKSFTVSNQDPDVPAPDKSSPDFSRRRAGPGFPSAEERNAYNQAYNQAYRDSWRRSYNEEFRRAYRADYHYSYSRGCDEARRLDFSYNYREGQQRGYSEGRQREYDQRFRPAFDLAHRRSYQRAYDDSYAAELPRAQRNIFEESRLNAFTEREKEIYDAIFARAKQENFAATYPRYQNQEYSRGKADEATDFTARPLRLVATRVSETLADGAMEPGEDLRLHLSVRNFAAAALRQEDVLLVVNSSDGIVTQETKINLGRDLRAQSVNQISDALDFQLPEYALREDFHLRLKLFYQGRIISEEDIALRGLYATEITLSGSQQLAEGLPRALSVTVKNRSTQTLPENTRVNLRANENNAIELPINESTLGALAPGESRTLEFPLIARNFSDQALLPLDVRIEAGARRLGRHIEERPFSVLNAYRVNISNDVKALRQAGGARLEYQITNNGSLEKGRALQVTVRFVGANAGIFSLPGVNPQYLAPVAQGRTVTFVAPVNVAEANGGGTLEIEIQEEGRPVIIRRIKF